MLDIKALLTKLLNVQVYGWTLSDQLARGSLRCSSFSALHNNLYRIHRAMYELNYYASSSYFTTVDSSHFFQLYAITTPTGVVDKSFYTIREYYHGVHVGTYIYYSGYISSWASSTSTSGTQYRQAATITFSTSELPYTYTQSIPLCLVSIQNTRVLGCSAAFTAARTLTINAIVTTSTALTDSNAWVNIFIYQAGTSNTGTISESLLVH